MSWHSEEKLSKEDWFKGYVATVLETPFPEAPPKEFKIGRTIVSWFESEPGIAVIRSRVGNCYERSFAEWVCKERLDAYGIKRAQFTFDQDSTEKTASWDDIMEKAKRLMDSGNVQMLRNGYNNIVAQVEGDHGSYLTEIGRDDPNSRAITTWQCECPWDQYAWQRTRKWKKYEGRPCHLPGSMITLANGSFKPIEDIKPGDRVITHRGASTVTQEMVRPYKGKIYKIYRAGFPYPIQVTENHEIWARKTPDKIRNAKYNQDIRKNQGFRIYDDSYVEEEPEWIDAQNLQVNDWIASTYVEDEVEGPGNAWATILGYYLAEGNLAKNGKSYNEVQWTFHKDELDLHQELYDALESIGLLGYRTYHPKNRNCVSIRISNKPLAEWLLRLGGHLASHKTLNGEVLQWPTEQLEKLIDAWVKGDGDLKKDGRQAINTSSQYLARQLYDILVKCGYIPSWTVQQNNGGPQNRSGKTPIHRIMFKWTKKDKANDRRKYKTRYMSKIIKIDKEWYEGPVYNLSVQDHESYVAEGVTNHNCAHVLAAYWTAQSMPLDEDASPQGQGQLFNPGMAPGSGGSAGPGGVTLPAPPQGQQLQIPGINPGMAQGTAPMAPGGGDIPGQPGNALLPPFPMAEQPPPPVSIPGGKPPTPYNPIQYPGGTFSKVADIDKGQPRNHQPNWKPGAWGKGILFRNGEVHTWNTNSRQDSQYWRDEDGWPFHSDYIMENLNNQPPAKPEQFFGINPQGEISTNNPYYLPYINEAHPELHPPENGSWRLLGATEDPLFDQSQWGNLQVRLNKPHYGVMQGKSELHGAGQYKEIPANSIGTLMEAVEDLGGQANVIFAGPQAQAEELQPYHVQAWVPISDITPMLGIKPPGPFIRRRTNAWQF